MAKQPLSVVLLSGGMDSAVAAALTAQESRIALMHLQFGQKAAPRELASYKKLCEHLNPVRQIIVDMGDWANITESPVVNPSADMTDAIEGATFISETFVPLLAQSMLCRAATWAYTLRAERVIWGISLDNPGNFPDRSDAVRLLCWQLVQRSLPEERTIAIEAPLAQYPKQAVAALAAELNVPIEDTWSCLRGGDNPCGACIGCQSRKKALSSIGIHNK